MHLPQHRQPLLRRHRRQATARLCRPLHLHLLWRLRRHLHTARASALVRRLGDTCPAWLWWFCGEAPWLDPGPNSTLYQLLPQIAEG